MMWTKETAVQTIGAHCVRCAGFGIVDGHGFCAFCQRDETRARRQRWTLALIWVGVLVALAYYWRA